MRYDVALTEDADSVSCAHLLQHYRDDQLQEDLCFALWYPSTGQDRLTAIIDEIVLPENGDRLLHGNASFTPDYMARALMLARQKQTGLAFMHSHPTSGWQDMSDADVVAERDILAYPSGATELPLLGLTVGTDGYWSARIWARDGAHMRRDWCHKVRIVGSDRYRVHFNDRLQPVHPRRNILRRTFDTWGSRTQNAISRLHVGIVGVGSVGCLVAEAIARLGITNVTLIDPDRIEEHNLDRLLYGTTRNIGHLKVDAAANAMKQHATAASMNIRTFPMSVHERPAYYAALDCDIIFCCVDRPVARDVLNYVAYAHLIPVIDGGIAVEVDQGTDRFFSAHWRSQIVTPYHQCTRCSKQYNSSMVVMELDGSLHDPSYIKNLSPENQTRNENVFPFSQSLASIEINLWLRYMLAAEWWPTLSSQSYYFLTGQTDVNFSNCHDFCSFRERRAKGDREHPFYLSDNESPKVRRSFYKRFAKLFDRIFQSG